MRREDARDVLPTIEELEVVQPFGCLRDKGARTKPGMYASEVAGQAPHQRRREERL